MYYSLPTMSFALMIHFIVSITIIPLQVSSFVAVVPQFSGYEREASSHSTRLCESSSFEKVSLDAAARKKMEERKKGRNMNTNIVSNELKEEDAGECLIGLSVEAQQMDLQGLEDLAPLERQMLRLEGLEPYVLVSVLTATTSYQTISDLAVTFDDGFSNFDMIATALLATSTMSTVAGVYATVVFSLCILYGKTALGLDKEEEYYYFMDQSATQRRRGFQAFSWSLILFSVDIFLLGIDKLPESVQLPASIVAAAISYFGYKEYKIITKGAEPIFTSIVPGKEELKSKNLATESAGSASTNTGKIVSNFVPDTVIEKQPYQSDLSEPELDFDSFIHHAIYDRESNDESRVLEKMSQ